MNYTLLLVNTLLITLSVVMLWKGSEWLVDNSAKLAHAWGVSDLVIGLTVVAIGTSAPEFAVTISSVLKGNSDISVSNVIGSNIFNLGFILGGTAWAYAISTSKKLVYRDGFFLIATTILLSFLLFDLHLEGDSMELSRNEGILLLVVLSAYLIFLFLKKEPLEEEEIDHGKISVRNMLFLLLGLAGVVGGGELLVRSSTLIAREFGLSDWVIGVTVVAAGTSTPELATAIMAIWRKKHGMAIGNLIGSDLFNLLGVLGVAGVLRDGIPVSIEAQSSMVMLVLMVMLVVFFMRTGWRISRFQGFLLVLINLIRWTYDFMGQTG
jgi:cation:H+ antiporter